MAPKKEKTKPINSSTPRGRQHEHESQPQGATGGAGAQQGKDASTSRQGEEEHEDRTSLHADDLGASGVVTPSTQQKDLVRMSDASQDLEEGDLGEGLDDGSEEEDGGDDGSEEEDGGDDGSEEEDGDGPEAA